MRRVDACVCTRSSRTFSGAHPVAQCADACNIGPSPQVDHKLDVLRAHCDAVGRDHDSVEKTTMFPITAASTSDDIVRTAESMRERGFDAAYIFAQQMPEPVRVIDVLAPAVVALR